MRSGCSLIAALVACAAALHAQPAAEKDAKSIVEKTVNTDRRNYHELQSWTYNVTDRIEKLDSAGRTKTVETTLDEVLYLGGKPYIHQLEKNGQPLAPKDAAKEQAKLDKAAAEADRLSDDGRRKRGMASERQREKDREQIRYLPEAYDFKLLGKEIVNGRAAWRIRATPLPGYKGKYSFLLKNLEGDLWIDEEDYQFVKADIHALRGFSIGLFLASVTEGSRLYFESVRLSDGIWAPKRIGFSGSARLLVKRIRQNEELQFFNYRKFQSDSRVVAAER